MNCIEVKGLSKKYGNFQSLQDVSFEIKIGDFLAILGPNGAGKSTLMKIISTLLKGYSGKVEICGYDIEKDSKKVREKIGIVPENFLLYDKLSAWENMIFFGGLYHLPRKVLFERAERFLKSVEMWDWRNKKIKEFSFGMKQRVNIARAFMNDPDVILLDEPTASLDIKSALAIKNLLKEVNGRGKTVIFTTHILKEVEEMANKVAILNFGNLVAFGTLEDLSKNLTEKTLTIEVEDHLQDDLFSKNGLKAQKIGQKVVFNYTTTQELDMIINMIAQSNLSLKSINSSKGDFDRLFLKLTDKGRDKN
ncbi:putative ABC transporter ATP-binding protein [Athalassotoga saccharophila]|nr:putative ABC transporter ATP-binding protein [Athalassotoga saccharophila]